MYADRGYDNRNNRQTGRGFGGYNNRSNFGRSNRSYEDRGYNDDGGYNNGGFDDRRKQGGRGRGRGRGGSFRDLPEGIDYVTCLRGHTTKVTAIALDAEGHKLYTGSKDGTVRAYNCDDATLLSSVEMGGPVDCLLFEAGYLFVGVTAPNKHGIIKVFQTATGQQMQLEGHEAEVLCMTAANGCLFSGSRDKTIRVWAFDPNTGQFMQSGLLTGEKGGPGHKAPVQAMTTIGNLLYTVDWQGTLKIWDASTGQLGQTILGAHSDIIMAMLQWEGHLITAGLDGLIRIWSHLETPVKGAILESAPSYTHPPDDENAGLVQAGKRGPGAGTVSVLGGILDMVGTLDPMGNPVLITTHNDTNCIRLWMLPTFEDRGTINEQQEVRAVLGGPEGVLFAGNRFGDVRVWQWRQGGGGAVGGGMAAE